MVVAAGLAYAPPLRDVFDTPAPPFEDMPVLLPLPVVLAGSSRRDPALRPVALVALVALTAIEAIVLLQAVDYAYARIGISAHAVLLLLVASVMTSAVNVPVARLRPVARRVRRRVAVFGDWYVVPTIEQPPVTIVAVNVGGAVIPVGLAAWLVAGTHAWGPAIAATAVVALVVHGAARIDPDVGIEIPAILPPLVAASVSLAIGGQHDAMVAYVAGTLGS